MSLSVHPTRNPKWVFHCENGFIYHTLSVSYPRVMYDRIRREIPVDRVPIWYELKQLQPSNSTLTSLDVVLTMVRCHMRREEFEKKNSITPKQTTIDNENKHYSIAMKDLIDDIKLDVITQRPTHANELLSTLLE
jgi:hypothetical protein